MQVNGDALPEHQSSWAAPSRAFNPVLHTMRAIGIVLVVLGHSCDPYLATHKPVQILKTIIYSFHMPVFFFVSGYLGTRIFNCTRRDYLPWLARQARRLLTVYLTCSVLIIPLKLAFAQYAHRPMGVWQAVEGIVLYPQSHPMATMWFLYVLFIVQAIFLTAACLGLLRHNRPLEVAGIIVLLLVLHEVSRRIDVPLFGLGNVAHYAIYFYLGFQAGRIGPRLQAFASRWSLVLLALPLAWTTYLSVRRLPGMSFVYAMIGIAVVWQVAAILVRGAPRPMRHLLMLLGDHAFAIYAYSYFVQVALRILLIDVLKWPNLAGLAVMCVASLLVPMAMVRFVLSRNKLLRRWGLGDWSDRPPIRRRFVGAAAAGPQASPDDEDTAD